MSDGVLPVQDPHAPSKVEPDDSVRSKHVAAILVGVGTRVLIVAAGRVFGQIIVVHTASLENGCPDFEQNHTDLTATNGQFSQQAGPDVLCS